MQLPSFAWMKYHKKGLFANLWHLILTLCTVGDLLCMEIFDKCWGFFLCWFAGCLVFVCMLKVKLSVVFYLIGGTFVACFIAPGLSSRWQVGHGVFLKPILIMLPQKSINYFPQGQRRQWRGSAILKYSECVHKPSECSTNTKLWRQIN